MNKVDVVRVAADAGAVQRSSRSEIRRVMAFGLVALVAIAIAPLGLDTFTVNSLIRAFLYAAVALTVDVLWGYTGILTFGQSAFFGIGAYAAGLVFTHLGFSPAHAALALAAGVLGAMLVAAVAGWLAFWHGASPLYVSVVTLVLPIVATQVIFSGGTFTGSSSGLSGFDSFDIGVEGWFRIAGCFLIVLTAATWIFIRSDAGRVLVAIRENEQRCEYLGIDTARLKVILLVVAAAVAALAGYAYAGFTTVVSPELAGFVFGTELVIWVALGGRGTLIGPVIGTILIDVGSAYLSGSLPFVWKLIIGLAFVVVIIAMPQGLIPLISTAFRSLVARTRGQGSPVFSAPALRSTQEAAAPSPLGPVAASIELHDVHRHYGSLKALEGIDFVARPGEILSLVGPNGAGKTTLMRCLSDGQERSGGKVVINGRDIARRPPQQCVALGIGRKFQAANVFDTLTVAQCLRIARTRLERPSGLRRAETLELPRSALQVIRATGLDQQLPVEARHLSHGLKQALELAMVLALEPSILLLDEPTAGLTKAERTQIGQALGELAGRHGLCILLVEHDLDFVREISSRVIVLHQGRIVLDGSVAQVVGSELVRTIYAGRPRVEPTEARA